MVQHKTTMNNWSNDGTTWLWYLGSEEELEALKVEAKERYGDRLEVGTPEPTSDGTRGPRRGWTFYMAFVFKSEKDAMLFKLSN
jgi:hypothetical protein